jgi:hypothetical protein
MQGANSCNDMKYGHRKGERIIRITSFETIKKGSWHLKVSVTNLHSFLITCKHITNKDLVFCKFFNDEMAALAFVDFIESQETYVII